MSRTLTLTDIIVVSAGVLVLLFWFILYFKGKKNWKLFIGLDPVDYPLKELYFVGYAFTEMLHFSYHGKSDRRIRKYLYILYGQKYVPEKIQKRSDEMMSDFSEVISKLALLVNAGMTLHEAWEDVARSGEGEIYKEMQASVENMRNGMAEVDAIFTFGQQCMVPEIKKFASTIITSFKRGQDDLQQMLMQQSKEVWEEKQQIMRRKGEIANSKLLIPIVLTFIGILIMVIVPIFSSMGA